MAVLTPLNGAANKSTELKSLQTGKTFGIGSGKRS